MITTVSMLHRDTGHAQDACQACNPPRQTSQCRGDNQAHTVFSEAEYHAAAHRVREKEHAARAGGRDQPRRRPAAARVVAVRLEVVEVVAAPPRAAGAQAGAVEQRRDDEGEHDAHDAGEVEGTAERGEGLGLGLGLGIGLGLGLG